METVARREAPSPFRLEVSSAGFAASAAKTDAVDFQLSRVGARRIAPHPWNRSAARAERRLGAGLRERVVSSGGRVDWSLVVDRQPGDPPGLTISARARVGRTFTMSDAVVRGRGGRRLARLPARIRKGRLEIEIPKRVVTAAEDPLTVEISVGPEHAVSEPIARSGVYTQREPAVAFNGSV